MKTLAQVTELLSKPYNGPTQEKNGFTYIPWNESVKAANRVFGIDGYSMDTLRVWREGAGYAALVRVTVQTSDSQPFHRDGIGYNDVTTRRDGAEMIDTAIKGAASDAANRAFKLFGEAFGLNLYDKAGGHSGAAPAPKADTASRPQATRPAVREDDGEEPTAKQIEWLIKKDIATDEDDALARFTKETAKAALDAAFNGGGAKKPAPARAATPRAAKAAPKDVDGVDDLDEFFA